MAVKFGSGITGLSSIRMLNRATDEGNRVRERLATGMRINRASDDPASLAVSATLTAETRIQRQGVRNISDGVSAVTITDSALESISNITTRLVELAEQAGNGVYTRTQRQALNAEFQSLSQEIDRISRTTTFNGMDLLRGESGTGTLNQITTIATGSGLTANALVLPVTADGKTAVVHNATTNQLQYIDTETGATTTIATTTLIPVILASTPRIAIDATGDTVAFISADNLTGQNASGYSQIYKYSRATGTITQITNSQGAEFFLGLAMSADGSTLAFDSVTEYGGSTVSYGSNQKLYTYNMESGTITNLGYTDLSNTSGALSLSANGSYLTFQTTNNSTGQNSDANFEHWIVGTGNPSQTLRQITTSTGADPVLFRSYVTNTGEVYLTSTLNHTGANSQGAGQIFKYNSATRSLTQITNSQGGGGGWVYGSNNDSRLYYLTLSDPFGGGLTNPTVYGYDISNNQFELLKTTPSNPTMLSFAVSADGSRVFGVSSVNLGSNSDGNLELIGMHITNSSRTLSIETGQGRSSTIDVSLSPLLESVRGVGGYLISSATAARGALRGLKENLQALSQLRGTLGAAGARLEIAHRLGTKQGLENEAAGSRIRDVDVATTASELVATEIRSQLSLFVLGQANQSAYVALRLLNGDKYK